MMSRRARISGLALLVLVDAPGTCHADLILSDMVRARVQSISFFAVCLLACVWGVRRIWNTLADEFSRLPRLSNGQAAGLLALCGLLFLLGFALISGARELMTPGAQMESEAARKLSEASKELDRLKEREEQIRRDRLESLSVLLHHYARGHGGKFPADDRVAEIPPEAWQLPGPARMHYLYAKGGTVGGAASPIVYEPGIFGKERLVLMTDGSVRKLGIHESEAMLTGRDK